MKNVCAVTSSRADYGILRPLLRCLRESPGLSLSIVATGMHLCPEFGNTVGEIEADGFTVDKKIDIQLSSDMPAGTSKSMGMALICFSEYFQEHPPDMLIVLGDRYEMAAVCCAAVNQRIPIAHLHGGEITMGAVDECYRHSITKMSVLHFTSCEAYRKRVIQLGEHPKRCFNVGALGVENALREPLLSLAELEQCLDFPLAGKTYCVVTFHPVTLEDNTGACQVRELMAALDNFPDMRFIITKSNSDAGGREINMLWDEFGQSRGNCAVVASLGMRRYLSVLKYAGAIIGNSSSGLMEAPAMKVPTVNIGDRQNGRIMVDSVLSCPPNARDIERTLRRVLEPEFKQLAADAENPYGDGNTSKKIADIIGRFLREGIPVQKQFYDIPFEVPL